MKHTLAPGSLCPARRFPPGTTHTQTRLIASMSRGVAARRQISVRAARGHGVEMSGRGAYGCARGAGAGAARAAACYLAELPRSAASQIDPGAETRAGINRIRTAGLRRDFRSGAGRRAAACAKCVDIALCPCYDGLSRRAPARRCRAGGLHMSEPRLSVRDRCACTGEAAHAACAWFSPRLLRAVRPSLAA